MIRKLFNFQPHEIFNNIHHRNAKLYPKQQIIRQMLRSFKTISYQFSQLKKELADLIPKKREELAAFKKAHGNKVVANIKAEQILTGMRQIPSIYYEGSKLDAFKGITFRGYDIPTCAKNSIKAKGGEEPLPEVMFYLLLTGKFPNQEQFDSLSNELRQHSKLSSEEVNFINALPKDMHPMTMLSIATLYLQRRSKFAAEYSKGMKKTDYWSYFYDDAIDLLGKLPEYAAIIYRNKYKGGKHIPSDPKLDWAGNYAHMLGYESNGMKEAMRGYLSIHTDHEGGNVSAHACHLVASALSDPYLSFSAGLNGLAGPLHGLANQECLKWILELKQYAQQQNKKPSKELIEDFVNKTLKDGKVVPGYGHAVLRHTDPRFTHELQFATKYIKNDEICNLVKLCYETIPGVLGKVGKIKNPYPNVDAHSGAILQHFGMIEYDYYTAVFGVSRAIGLMANGIWSRALGLAIERPNSVDLKWLSENVANERKENPLT